MYIKPPFVSTPVETLKNIRDFFTQTPNLKGKKAVDLGSGNGRVVIEMAKHGLLVTGFEEKNDLVKIAQEKIKETNSPNAQIVQADYWQKNLSEFNIIYIYGIPAIMGKLEDKFKNELFKHTIIISNVYKLPTIKEKKTFGTLYMYVM